MEESINIREYISIFKRRKWIIIVILLISLGCGVFLTYIRNKSYIPQYETSTRIRINSSKSTPEQGFSSAVTTLNQSISSTYLSLAKSNATLQEVINTLGLDKTPEILSSQISVSADESNSEFVTIVVRDTDPQLATKIANTVPTAFNNELIKTIKLDCIQVIDLAVDSKEPIPPAKSKAAIKLGIIGLVVAIFVVLLLEFLNNKIITPKDAEEYWGIPLIGVVPYQKSSKNNEKI